MSDYKPLFPAPQPTPPASLPSELSDEELIDATKKWRNTYRGFILLGLLWFLFALLVVLFGDPSWSNYFDLALGPLLIGFGLLTRKGSIIGMVAGVTLFGLSWLASIVSMAMNLIDGSSSTGTWISAAIITFVLLSMFVNFAQGFGALRRLRQDLRRRQQST
jgi:hypothetical protein